MIEFLIVLSAIIVFIVGGFRLAEKYQKIDRREALEAQRPHSPPANAKQIEGSKYMELDDEPPVFVPDPQPPLANVIQLADHQANPPADQRTMRYSLSTRVTARGLLTMVISYIKGHRHLHIDSHFGMDGTPLAMQMHMLDQPALGQEHAFKNQA